MLSFSWSMSLFGCEQMGQLLRAGTGVARAGNALNAVVRSTEEQLASGTRATFLAGDRWQRGMVDLVFDLFTKGRVASAPAATESSAPATSGWGPMPGTDR